MKNTFKISILPVVCMIVVLMSCVHDLDVTPIDPRVTTSANVYTDVASYKSGLAKVYATLALSGQVGPAGAGDVGGVDEGFSTYTRALFSMNEFPTDEALWSYPADANGTIFSLHHNNWVPSDIVPTAFFARIMNVVAITNEFLRATASSSDPDIKRFHEEARFVRAIAYYHGLDLFRNMPFITEADLPGAYFPPQIAAADLFKYIESELKAIKPELGDARFEYGRADKTTCAMLLAKLYLNAEVYIGTPMYTESLTEVKEVIAGGYTLAPSYINNFLADNNTSLETIFAQTFDGTKSEAYSAPWMMIYGSSARNTALPGYTLTPLPLGVVTNGFAGLRTTKALVAKFANEKNKARYLFATESNGQALEIAAENQTRQGYGVIKFRNATSAGVIGSNPSFQDNDFPMFRLADAYLMYAELVLRGATGGDLATALSYVNAIRTRPGDVAKGIQPGAITSTDLTLDFLIDERARELYWEGHRRPDLIRFGKFTGGTYLWPWKGGVAEGTSIDDNRKIFPIPASDVANNPNLKQNKEYL